MVGDKNKKNKTKNSVEIEAYLKPSWVLASTKNYYKNISNLLRFLKLVICNSSENWFLPKLSVEYFYVYVCGKLEDAIYLKFIGTSPSFSFSDDNKMVTFLYDGPMKTFIYCLLMLTILLRAECLRCTWLLAEMKVATILGILPSSAPSFKSSLA
jgi:hypothetical protein